VVDKDDTVSALGVLNERQLAVLTPCQRHRSAISDDDFARITGSIQHSLDLINKVIDRCLSFCT
jgi:hypothetical protein